VAKLIIKITVDQTTDPDLYASVAPLPRRRRAAVIRRLCSRGLVLESCGAAPPGQPRNGTVRAPGKLPFPASPVSHDSPERMPVDGDSFDIGQLTGLATLG